MSEAGKYEVKIGASSSDIKKTEKFDLPKTIVVEKVHNVMKPDTAINALKRP